MKANTDPLHARRSTLTTPTLKSHDVFGRPSSALGTAVGRPLSPPQALVISSVYGRTTWPSRCTGSRWIAYPGRIAQHLYQSADIRIMPYEDVRIEENRYNLIISNVPFSEIKPYEDRKTRTPGLDGRYALHDFYFLKSLYGTRPGGLIAFITSRYTMDKESKEVREKIAESADFVGAMRLPNNTFTSIANTEVVTDIVFLQKRPVGQEPTELTQTFLDTAEIELEGKGGKQRVHINEYFIDNPQFVLGRAELAGTMYKIRRVHGDFDQ